MLEAALVVALALIVILPAHASREIVERDRDRPFLPAWMGQSDLEGSIRKLIGVVCAIASLQPLKKIELIDDLSDRYLGSLIGMLVAFVITALLQSVADRLTGGSRKEGTPPLPRAEASPRSGRRPGPIVSRLGGVRPTGGEPL